MQTLPWVSVPDSTTKEMDEMKNKKLYVGGEKKDP